MGKRFNMNDLLNEQSKKALERVVNDFEVWQIPIGKIVPSPNNKYGIRDIEELAANIEAMGLMQSLVVQKIVENGTYQLISGERRYQAMKLLYESGNEKYATVPCKVENDSDEIQELKLLFANSTARELTDYEKTYQAQRIKELLVQLKKAGKKFPGKIRDYVAEILKVSSSQVGRMESISKKLTPEFTEEFKADRIGVSAAYELSTLPPKEQEKAFNKYQDSGTIAPKEVKAQREKAKPASDLPVPPTAEMQSNSVQALQLTTAPTTPEKPKPAEAPVPQQPQREKIISGLYAAASDLSDWNDARADNIAAICRAAADMLKGDN